MKVRGELFDSLLGLVVFLISNVDIVFVSCSIYSVRRRGGGRNWFTVFLHQMKVFYANLVQLGKISPLDDIARERENGTIHVQ